MTNKKRNKAEINGKVGYIIIEDDKVIVDREDLFRVLFKGRWFINKQSSGTLVRGPGSPGIYLGKFILDDFRPNTVIRHNNGRWNDFRKKNLYAEESDRHYGR